MAKYLHIQVENPCRQKWEDMQSNAEGNFCSSCKKTVVDFSVMTDNQLIEFISKHGSGICGRFYNEQLDTKLKMPVKRIPWLKYFFSVTIPAMLLSYKAGAQQFIKKQQERVVVSNKKLHRSTALAAIPAVSGRITGNNGEPIPFASVMLAGTKIGTAADSNGLFKIQLPGTVRTLEITAVGYKKKELIITGSYIDVQLDIITMEAVVLAPVTVVSHRGYTLGGMTSVITVRSMWSNKEKVVKAVPATIEIFPNPVKRAGLLTIRWKKPVTHNQQVIIYNAVAAKMMEKVIAIDRPLQQTQLSLDLDAAGYYLIEIIDGKTHKKEVLKFMAE